MAETDPVEWTAPAAEEPSGPLTDADVSDLAEAEQTIQANLQAYISVGMALGRIRDRELYRGTHQSFGDYVRSKWGISRSYAYSLMLASGTVSAIADAGLPAPPNEAQARELARVAEADRVAVWREVLELTGGTPTAAAISEVAAERARAERSEVLAEAKARSGGKPTVDDIRQVRAERAAAAGADSPPDRAQEQTPPPGDAPAVATTGPAGDDLPRGVEGAPAGGTPPAGAGPSPTDEVWIAVARRGITGHAPDQDDLTRCRRSTRNGLTLTAAAATEKHAAGWCATCWPPAQPVVEAACGRCGTMTPLDELLEMEEPDDGVRQCTPCRTQPPDYYVTTLLPYSALLPGDYLEHWLGADGSVLGHDLVTHVHTGASIGGGRGVLMTVSTTGRDLERRDGDEVKVRRMPDRTKASGGVTDCATCYSRVPVVITYNDRCPACVTDVDQAAMMQAKLAAQAPDMVPGPEQEVVAAQVRAGDLVWASWRKGTSGGVGWLPVTYVEIAAEPEGPGEWVVHLRARTSTEHTATAALTYFWDDETKVRRPVPGTAEPAELPAPDPSPAVVVPVEEPAAAAPPVEEPSAPARPARPPLTVEQIGRLRAAYRAARAAGWRHVKLSRNSPCDVGRDYGPDDPAPARPDRNGAPVVRVDVGWDTELHEVEISYRSERYHLYDTVLRVVDVDQGIDVLCALGFLPIEQSRAYLAGTAAAEDRVASDA